VRVCGTSTRIAEARGNEQWEKKRICSKRGSLEQTKLNRGLEQDAPIRGLSKGRHYILDGFAGMTESRNKDWRLEKNPVNSSGES